MDPLTILGATCNILQLVETGYKGLALCWRLYKNGEDIKTSDLRETSESLERGHKRLQDLLQNASLPLSPDDNDLFDLCTKCQEICSSLLSELDQLILPIKSNVLQVIGKALKSATKAGKIEQLSSQLEQMRKTLDSHILISTHAMLKQLDPNTRKLSADLDQRSREILDAIAAGRLQLATLLSENALASQKFLEKELLVTRNQIEDARAGLAKTIVGDGSSTRKRIDSFSTKFDSMTLDNKRHELFKSVLRNLEYSEIFSRSDSIDDPHRDTCNWIFEHDAFADWLTNEDQLFWIQGKAGSGKSTLMNFLAEDENGEVQQGLCQWAGNQPVVVLSFYLWESGTELQRSAEGLLRSLMYQLLSQAKHSQSLMQIFLSIREIADIGDSSRRLTMKRLIKLFPRAVTSSGLYVCIFLDGLDEFGEDEELLGLIDNLQGLDRIKICTSSRSSPAFEDYFRETSKLRVHQLTASAIEKYVRERLMRDNRLRMLASKDRFSAQCLFEEIVESAEGVFLWVSLVVQDLIRGLRNKDDLMTLQRRVERQPRGIQDLYEVMWNRNKVDHDIYEEEAALYFEMALRSRRVEDWTSHTPLVFFLAQNDNMRKRCLESASDPDVPWLGLELDKESLSTRIQTCTAGLLELRPGSSTPASVRYDFDDPELALSDVPSDLEDSELTLRSSCSDSDNAELPSRTFTYDLDDTGDFDQDSTSIPDLIEWSCSTTVTFIHKSAQEFLKSSPTFKKLLASQRHGQLNLRRITESEILNWALKCMARNSINPWLPNIQDEEMSLPLIDRIETLLNRFSRQQGFEWSEWLYNSFRNRLWPNSSETEQWSEKSGQIDFVAFILYQGLANIVQSLIKSRDYPKELFTNLLAYYDPWSWAQKPLLQYLVAHGADQSRHFEYQYSLTPFPDPSRTVAQNVLDSNLFHIFSQGADIKACVDAIKFLLEQNPNQTQWGLPLVGVQDDPTVGRLILGVSAHGRIATVLGVPDWLGPEEHALLSPLTGFTEAKRVYAFQRSRTIWPIDEKYSALFFDKVLPLVGQKWRSSVELMDDYIKVGQEFCVDPEIAWFFDEIMLHGEPFETVEDAYRHMGWTNEDLAEYWEPLKSLKPSQRRKFRLVFNLERPEWSA